MAVTLELAEDLAQLLVGRSVGLSRVAVESLALEGIRAGKINAAQARRLLGMSRNEMNGFLKAHGLMLPGTISHIEHDGETAAHFRHR